MGEVIGFLILMSIAVYCVMTQRPADKRRKQYYLDKANEFSLKGEHKVADRYYDIASRIK